MNYKRTSLSGVIRSYKGFNIAKIKKDMHRVFTSEEMQRPSFASSWVISSPPEHGKLLEEYNVGRARIQIYALEAEPEVLYFVNLPEYSMGEKYVKLVYLAKERLLNHLPRFVNVEDLEETRIYIKDMGAQILQSLAKQERISLGATSWEADKKVSELVDVLVHYTVGFGAVEVLMADDHVQDIYIDAPAEKTPVYITIGGFLNPEIYGKAITNIILSTEDAQSMLSRFRYESGRPFSEAFPLLETDLKSHGTRVTVIGKPLSPQGIAIALRRHSSEPWTLLKLIANGTLNSLSAGLLSYLVDGRSTILVAGSRGAGKTSLLGALMLELPKSQRILTIEDTLELPVEKMKSLGYKVQSLYVRSSLEQSTQFSASDALRVSLRLGESAIVMGEVRGQEARTLYEAMRAGSAGSAVMGTFHADSPRAVYERVVHDMQISPKSFLATDIIVISGLARPQGRQKFKRRLLAISEVVGENQFNYLMLYNEERDALIPTDIFNYGSEKIGKIARSWGLSLEEAMHNIELRARYRQIMVDYAIANNMAEMLSAEWVVKANNMFWALVEKHGKDYQKIMTEWQEWFRRCVAGE